ncbi:MAG: TMEM175 family protein [Mucilaginibacter sp.]|uniref:TMEM175 family protein n=1 Tax=Mucilaginibacter sp. TaxID=1882438 RepID=UPI00326786C7
MEDKELKHEFELERVILFSDAVFAIIITIMILDVKLPEGLKHASADEIKHAFKELMPKLFAYMASFGLIGVFWTRHLKIFKNLRDYDMKLVAGNLFFLFVISLFPFAISTITSGLTLNNYWTVDIYLGIILTGIFAQTIIIGHIVKHKEKLSFNPEAIEDILKWKAMKYNYFIYPLAMITLIVLTIIQVEPTFIMYTLVVYALAIRVISNKYYPVKKKLKLKEEEIESQIAIDN